MRIALYSLGVSALQIVVARLSRSIGDSSGAVRSHTHRRRGILPRTGDQASNYNISSFNCVSPITIYLTSHADWQISIGQRSAAYQSSIRFRIVGEEIKRSKAIGAGCERKVEQIFTFHT